jgi:E3 SUMO-protein ligase PIAS1
MIGGPRVEASKTPTTSLATPTSANRSETSAPRGLGSTSGKRPAAAVIDLTLSSDDEDDNQPIQRPAKRQNLGPSTTFNGYRDHDRLGFLSSESPVNYNN